MFRSVCLGYGVRIGMESDTCMRAVTHLDVSRQDVEEAADALATVVSEN